MTASAREALIGELLGETGQLVLQVERLNAELRSTSAGLTTAVADLDLARDLTVRAIVASTQAAQRRWGDSCASPAADRKDVGTWCRRCSRLRSGRPVCRTRWLGAAGIAFVGFFLGTVAAWATLAWSPWIGPG